MHSRNLLGLIGCMMGFSAFGGGPAKAQVPPWDAFQDAQTGQTCDLVNAGNAELVVLSGTGELVIVTGVDVIVLNSFVDFDSTVFLDGLPFGIIDFETDGDGFRSLWWLTLTGTVVDIDPFTLEPLDSGHFPDDFVNVPCDACPLWDDPADCDGGVIFDTDADGIPDVIDDCPDTPLGADVDFGGCACFEIDSDDDGVDDCDDACPDTPPSFDVDFDGCACFDLDSDLDGVDDCDDLCPHTPPFDGVDFDGCACFEIDSDADGVDDCDDNCPNTPLDAAVDSDGCTIVVVPPPPITIACGNFGSLTMALMFSGLVAMRFVGRPARTF